MKSERKGIIQKILCMLMAAALVAVSIPLNVNSAEPKAGTVQAKKVQKTFTEQQLSTRYELEEELTTKEQLSTEEESSTEEHPSTGGEIDEQPSTEEYPSSEDENKEESSNEQDSTTEEETSTEDEEESTTEEPTTEESKQEQVLLTPTEAISATYGDIIDIAAYVKEHMREENKAYSEILEITGNDADKIQLAGTKARVIGISEDGEAVKLSVRYLEDDDFEPSNQVEIPIKIHCGKPQITFRLQQDSQWQTDKKLQIHGELAIHANIKMEEGASYEDFLQDETKLKLQYRIIHEATGSVKEYIQSFGWNTQLAEKTFQTVLPVGWRYFPKLHKNETYRIEMAVIYTGAENPYELPAKQSCQLTLQAANAYIQTQQQEIQKEYREALGQTYQLPFTMKHKRLGIDREITDVQELSQIAYGVSTSASDVADVNSKAQYAADTTTQIPYTVTGVGESDIQIQAAQSWTYDVADATVKVKVANSGIQKEDYQFHYAEDDKELTFDYSQWQEYLKAHKYWLKAPVTMTITDIGLRYYDTLGCHDLTNDTELKRKDSISFVKSRQQSIPMAEYAVWMEQESKHASTKDVGDAHIFSMGIDQKAPLLIAASDNGKKRYENTSDSDSWYMGEHFVLEGTYEDETSGNAKIEYSIDAGKSWKPMQMKTSDAMQHLSTFKLTLRDGEYSGVAVRAVDTAGNISNEYRLANKAGEFIKIVVDTRIPKLEIKVTNAQGSQQGVETWTNQALSYQYVENKDNPDIYRIFYQYVPIQQVIEAKKNGKIPFTDKEWHELDKNGMTVGAANTGDAAVNRNGIYYFKTVSMCGLESDVISKIIKLQQTIPELMPYTVENGTEEQWYAANTKLPKVEFACDEYLHKCVTQQEYQAPITVHRRLTSSQGIDEKTVRVGFENTQEYEAYLKDKSLYSDLVYRQKMQELALDFTNMPDDKYELSYWIEDAAGNRCEVVRQPFWIDTTPPDSIQVWIEGKEYPNGEFDSIVYDTFSQTSLHGKIDAKDALSGIKSIKILRAKRIGEWKNATATEEGTSFTIEPSTRCFLYIVAEDEAGNQTAVWTNGMVVEEEAPTGQSGRELILEPQGVNENGFYNEDVAVEIAIKDMPTEDNYSALELVKYRITSGSAQAEKILFSGNKSAASEEDLRASSTFETKELVDAMQYEGNEVNLEVTAKDRAGNETTSTQLIKIDVTAPTIEITFDQTTPRRERFYQTDRIATIHITELNFDAGAVEWEVTRNGEPYAMNISEWTHQDNEHYATMTFSEDGDYTLQVKCRDLADNEAEPAKTEPFTIDQTLPVIEINYDGDAAYLENYFNSDKTAVITITEHNFDALDFEMNTPNSYTTEGWTHDGDTHRLRVRFEQDDHYIWNCYYTDMAGNEAEPPAQEEFYIDTKAPEISISGVLDQSANAGDIFPVITIREEHYNTEQTQILITNGTGQPYEVKKSANPIEGGFVYTLTDMNEQPDNIYYLTVESLDMAGNAANLTYRFSLNRNGSAYDMSLVEQATAHTYYRSAAMDDLKITEMNVDKIEKFSLYVSQNGTLIPSRRIENRSQIRDGEMCYQVEELGNEQVGYTYIYTLYHENFAKEGGYNIAFYSKDTAGNEVSSTLEDKNAGISFFIDDTPPQVVLDGIEDGGIYDEARRQVNVLFTDNTLLKQANLALSNDKGEELNSWDYMEQTGQAQPLSIEIREYDGGQRLSYHVVDAAGNSSKVSMDFMITTNPWVRMAKSMPTGRIIAGLMAFCCSIGGAIWYQCRRRRRG